MGFVHRDFLTPQDYAFLAAQERNHQLVSDTLGAIHRENALKRLLRGAKSLQERMEEAGQDEAAECLRTAQAALEDAQEAAK